MPRSANKSSTSRSVWVQCADLDARERREVPRPVAYGAGWLAPVTTKLSRPFSDSISRTSDPSIAASCNVGIHRRIDEVTLPGGFNKRNGHKSAIFERD
jgi:hypothetical protein